MTGRHEQYPSPSITGRGSYRHDRRNIVSKRERLSNRRNLWSRRSQQSLIRTNRIQLPTPCVRQRSGGATSSQANPRYALPNDAQQFCTNGSACQSPIRGCRITRFRYQFTTNRYTRARIFISLRWATRHAHGYELRSISSRVACKRSGRGDYPSD